MARDYNKGIIKKKANHLKRKRKVGFDGDHYGSLEGSFEQEMLLKRSRKKKTKARKKTTKKDKKKRDFRVLLPPLPKVHVVQATPDDMRKSVNKIKGKEGKKKMFIKMVSARASSVDSNRDGPSVDSSDLNYKTLEIIESVTTSEILGNTKLIQTNLQYRNLQLPVSDFMTSDARRFKFEPFKCSPPRTTLRYYYKMRSSSVTSSDESLRKWRMHEEESRRLMSVEVESAPGAKEILAQTPTSSGPRARFSSILEHVEPRSSTESQRSIKPRKLPRDSIAPLRRPSLKKPKEDKPEDRPPEEPKTDTIKEKDT